MARTWPSPQRCHPDQEGVEPSGRCWRSSRWSRPRSSCRTGPATMRPADPARVALGRCSARSLRTPPGCPWPGSATWPGTTCRASAARGAAYRLRRRRRPSATVRRSGRCPRAPGRGGARWLDLAGVRRRPHPRGGRGRRVVVVRRRRSRHRRWPATARPARAAGVEPCEPGPTARSAAPPPPPPTSTTPAPRTGAASPPSTSPRQRRPRTASPTAPSPAPPAATAPGAPTIRPRGAVPAGTRLRTRAGAGPAGAAG